MENYAVTVEARGDAVECDLKQYEPKQLDGNAYVEEEKKENEDDWHTEDLLARLKNELQTKLLLLDDLAGFPTFLFDKNLIDAIENGKTRSVPNEALTETTVNDLSGYTLDSSTCSNGTDSSTPDIAIMHLEDQKNELQEKMKLLEEQAELMDLELQQLDIDLAALEQDQFPSDHTDVDLVVRQLNEEPCKSTPSAQHDTKSEPLSPTISQHTSLFQAETILRSFVDSIPGVEIKLIEQQQQTQVIHATLLIRNQHRLWIMIEQMKSPILSIREAEFLIDESKKTRQLYMPPLDDVVRTLLDDIGSQHGSPDGGLQHLMTIALERLDLWDERQAQLDFMRDSQHCYVEVIQNRQDPDDDLFQQITCEFGIVLMDKSTGVVTATMRMTPNCPRVVGSVFLETLTCSAPDYTTLTRAATKYIQARQMCHSSPVTLMEELQGYLALSMRSLKQGSPTVI